MTNPSGERIPSGKNGNSLGANLAAGTVLGIAATALLVGSAHLISKISDSGEPTGQCSGFYLGDRFPTPSDVVSYVAGHGDSAESFGTRVTFGGKIVTQDFPEHSHVTVLNVPEKPCVLADGTFRPDDNGTEESSSLGAVTAVERLNQMNLPDYRRIVEEITNTAFPLTATVS
jgi:hypothetical protein